MKAFFSIVLLVAMISGGALAAPSFLGMSGNIFTPDDVVLAPGAFSANLHSIDTDDSTLIIGASVGVTESLELGIGRYDSDDGQTFVNAKYSVLPETISRPSITIGAVDVTGELDPGEDPGFFIVLGKNLTSVASNVAGEPSAPLRGTIGFGTGILDGFFAGLDWTLTPKISAMAEFLAEDSVFNAGVRLAVTENLRIDAALIDMDDLGFGISYTLIGID